jgi:hypothetical protein
MEEAALIAEQHEQIAAIYQGAVERNQVVEYAPLL